MFVNKLFNIFHVKEEYSFSRLQNSISDEMLQIMLRGYFEIKVSLHLDLLAKLISHKDHHPTTALHAEYKVNRYLRILPRRTYLSKPSSAP